MIMVGFVFFDNHRFLEYNNLYFEKNYIVTISKE